MDMNTQTIKKIVKEELPGLMKRDKQFRQFVIQLTREQLTELDEKTGKIETKMDSRFDRVLDELRKDREAQTKKWEEQNRKWDEENRKWDEQNLKWEELSQILDELRKDREAQAKKWEEQDRKWEGNQKEIRQLFKSIERLDRKHETTIGALGARWGLRSEASFRNALKGILKDFDIEVIHVDEFDDEGEVFGRPDNVELDIILVDGKLMICELKSSMSKPEMYTFYKKAMFYEKRHNRKADRMIVISPMVLPKAVKVAKTLGITIYSYPREMGEGIESSGSSSG